MTTIEQIESKTDTDYTFGDAKGKKGSIRWHYRKRGMIFSYQLFMYAGDGTWSNEKAACLMPKELEEFIQKKIN